MGERCATSARTPAPAGPDAGRRLFSAPSRGRDGVCYLGSVGGVLVRGATVLRRDDPVSTLAGPGGRDSRDKAATVAHRPVLGTPSHVHETHPAIAACRPAGVDTLLVPCQLNLPYFRLPPPPLPLPRPTPSLPSSSSRHPAPLHPTNPFEGRDDRNPGLPCIGLPVHHSPIVAYGACHRSEPPHGPPAVEE